MKLLTLAFLLPFFLTISCKKNCSDCGPISSGTYFLHNNFDFDVTLFFYGNSSTGYMTDSLKIKKMERLQFFANSTGSPGYKALRFEISQCDSAQIKSLVGTVYTIKSIEFCQNVENFLCQANYKLLKREEINSGKEKGNVYSEYEFLLKK